MSWYDYIPGVGSVDAAIHGNYGQAAGDLLTAGSDIGYQGAAGLYNKLYKDPAAKKAAALDQASAQAKALGQDVWNKAMQGKNEALAQFAPADAAWKALYGDPKNWTVAKAPGAAPGQQVAPGPGSVY